jgi:hypothetical protein
VSPFFAMLSYTISIEKSISDIKIFIDFFFYLFAFFHGSDMVKKRYKYIEKIQILYLLLPVAVVVCMW